MACIGGYLAPMVLAAGVLGVFAVRSGFGFWPDFALAYDW
jgi:hypothetical protein